MHLSFTTNVLLLICKELVSFFHTIDSGRGDLMAYVESESLSLMFRIIYFNRAPGPLGATDFLKGVHSVSCYSSVGSVFNHLDSLESLKIQVYICI